MQIYAQSYYESESNSLYPKRLGILVRFQLKIQEHLLKLDYFPTYENPIQLALRMLPFNAYSCS